MTDEKPMPDPEMAPRSTLQVIVGGRRDREWEAIEALLLDDPNVDALIRRLKPAANESLWVVVR